MIPLMHSQLLSIQLLPCTNILLCSTDISPVSNNLFIIHPSYSWYPSQPRTFSSVVPHPFTPHNQTITTLPALIDWPTLSHHQFSFALPHFSFDTCVTPQTPHRHYIQSLALYYSHISYFSIIQNNLHHYSLIQLFLSIHSRRSMSKQSFHSPNTFTTPIMFRSHL